VGHGQGCCVQSVTACVISHGEIGMAHPPCSGFDAVLYVTEALANVANEVVEIQNVTQRSTKFQRLIAEQDGVLKTWGKCTRMHNCTRSFAVRARFLRRPQQLAAAAVAAAVCVVRAARCAPRHRARAAPPPPRPPPPAAGLVIPWPTQAVVLCAAQYQGYNRGDNTGTLW
jgi:hypothetical protein